MTLSFSARRRDELPPEIRPAFLAKASQLLAQVFQPEVILAGGLALQPVDSESFNAMRVSF
jgi:hypothetical protein